MNDLETLIATALIGTERQAIPAFSLVPDLNADTKEAKLLSAAAILTAYRRAGYVPKKSLGIPRLEVSPSDSKPEMTAAMRNVLQQILRGNQELLEEYLKMLSGYRFAHQDLPRMLDFGHGNTALRAQISDLLDARGRWLAGLNKQWSWATGNTESLEEAVQSFETGSKSARALALHAIRSADVKRGRTLLESTWKQDAAPERKEFIAILETGLSDRDEAFLENALNDRSSDVRDHAARLLSKLPNSQFNARIRERLRPILNVKKDKLGGLLRPLTKTNNDKLEIVLPDAFDPAWVKDGIEEKAPQGVGQKQYWVRQMLERTNLKMLEELTELSAIDLLKNTHKDWQNFIRNAVINSLRQNPERELVKQLIAYDITTVQAANAFGALEPSFLETLTTQRTLTEANTDLSLIHACQHVWSETFCAAVLEWIAKQTLRLQQGTLKESFYGFADPIIRLTPLEMIPRVISGNPSIPNWTVMLSKHLEPASQAVKQPYYWHNAQQQFGQILNALQLRLEMHTAFNQSTVTKETHE
jgi:Family of unknown function (DUF5691)